MIRVDGADTERTVTISGPPREMEELARELQSWTPAQGWSSQASELFYALKGE